MAELRYTLILICSAQYVVVVLVCIKEKNTKYWQLQVTCIPSPYQMHPAHHTHQFSLGFLRCLLSSPTSLEKLETYHGFYSYDAGATQSCHAQGNHSTSSYSRSSWISCCCCHTYYSCCNLPNLTKLPSHLRAIVLNAIVILLLFATDILADIAIATTELSYDCCHHHNQATAI